MKKTLSKSSKAKSDTRFKCIKLSPIQQVDVGKLKGNPLNGAFTPPKTDFIKEFMLDVSERGILTALVAKKDGTLLSGHTRLLVARSLQMDKVPVQYVEQKLTLDDERKYVVADNVIRRQLSHKERLNLYQLICPELSKSTLDIDTAAIKYNSTRGITIRELAKKSGISVGTVSQDLNLKRAQDIQKQKKVDINMGLVNSIKGYLTRALQSTYNESDKTKAEVQKVFNDYVVYFNHINEFTLGQTSHFSSGSVNIKKNKVLLAAKKVSTKKIGI